MNRKVLSICGALVLTIAACSTNPITGKRQVNVVPNSQLFPTAFAQYDQFLKENKVVTGTKEAAMVTSVGQKIKAAAEKYLASLGQAEYLNGYQWEYKLVQSNEVNAWCMPGGKIVIYSGILPVTKDEAGLATVMGHEVAHALLNHGGQRMTTDMAQQIIGQGVAVASSGQSTAAQQIINQAYGAGSQYLGVLPFSRSHENEADKVGLSLMAIAGYNPDKAIEFWQRMSAKSGGSSVPEFMSTHPSDATRVNNITKEIPNAKANATKLGIKATGK